MRLGTKASDARFNTAKGSAGQRLDSHELVLTLLDDCEYGHIARLFDLLANAVLFGALESWCLNDRGRLHSG